MNNSKKVEIDKESELNKLIKDMKKNKGRRISFMRVIRPYIHQIFIILQTFNNVDEQIEFFETLSNILTVKDKKFLRLKNRDLYKVFLNTTNAKILDYIINYSKDMYVKVRGFFISNFFDDNRDLGLINPLKYIFFNFIDIKISCDKVYYINYLSIISYENDKGTLIIQTQNKKLKIHFKKKNDTHDAILILKQRMGEEKKGKNMQKFIPDNGSDADKNMLSNELHQKQSSNMKNCTDNWDETQSNLFKILNSTELGSIKEADIQLKNTEQNYIKDLNIIENTKIAQSKINESNIPDKTTNVEQSNIQNSDEKRTNQFNSQLNNVKNSYKNTESDCLTEDSKFLHENNINIVDNKTESNNKAGNSKFICENNMKIVENGTESNHITEDSKFTCEDEIKRVDQNNENELKNSQVKSPFDTEKNILNLNIQQDTKIDENENKFTREEIILKDSTHINSNFEENRLKIQNKKFNIDKNTLICGKNSIFSNDDRNVIKCEENKVFVSINIKDYKEKSRNNEIFNENFYSKNIQGKLYSDNNEFILLDLEGKDNVHKNIDPLESRERNFKNQKNGKNDEICKNNRNNSYLSLDDLNENEQKSKEMNKEQNNENFFDVKGDSKGTEPLKVYNEDIKYHQSIDKEIVSEYNKTENMVYKDKDDKIKSKEESNNIIKYNVNKKNDFSVHVHDKSKVEKLLSQNSINEEMLLNLVEPKFFNEDYVGGNIKFNIKSSFLIQNNGTLLNCIRNSDKNSISNNDHSDISTVESDLNSLNCVNFNSMSRKISLTESIQSSSSQDLYGKESDNGNDGCYEYIKNSVVNLHKNIINPAEKQTLDEQSFLNMNTQKNTNNNEHENDKKSLKDFFNSKSEEEAFGFSKKFVDDLLNTMKSSSKKCKTYLQTEKAANNQLETGTQNFKNINATHQYTLKTKDLQTKKCSQSNSPCKDKEENDIFENKKISKIMKYKKTILLKIVDEFLENEEKRMKKIIAKIKKKCKKLKIKKEI